MSSLIDVSYSPYSMNTIYTLMLDLQKAILINLIYTEQKNILTSKIKCVQGQVLINFTQAFFSFQLYNIFYIFISPLWQKKDPLILSPLCHILYYSYISPPHMNSAVYPTDMVLKSSTSLHQYNCDSLLALSTSKQLEACSCIVDAPLTALLLICGKISPLSWC